MTQFIKDLSGNNKDGYFSSGNIVRTPNGLYFAADGAATYCGSITLSSSITIEEWVQLSLSQRTITVLDGSISIKLIDRTYWQVSVGGSVYRAKLEVAEGDRLFIALSHSFGNGSSILLSINGKVASGSWISGNGNDAMSGPAAFAVRLGTGDYLQQLYISHRTKTIEEIRAYLGGGA